MIMAHSAPINFILAPINLHYYASPPTFKKASSVKPFSIIFEMKINLLHCTSCRNAWSYMWLAIKYGGYENVKYWTKI